MDSKLRYCHSCEKDVKAQRKLFCHICSECRVVLRNPSFAIDNLQKLHKKTIGECKTCSLKSIYICKHGHCYRCSCPRLCWLD